MPRVVAGHVLAMLGELHGIALIGAAVHSAERALDDIAGAELQIADLREDLRTKVAFVFGGHVAGS